MKQRLIILVVSALLLQGCETLSFYSQAIKGQLSILHNREDIAVVLSDHTTSDEVKSKLNLILEAKTFAKVELHLPTDNLYTHYLQLEKPYVVWNVFAAPKLSIKPTTWCYPVVGCLSYRGYFSEEDALNFASSLNPEQYDVFVGGISAYSTLGWFNDPILSSFFSRRDEELTGLIFHELSHQILFFKGDTTFNESFATTVELEGLKRFLNTQNKDATYTEKLKREKRGQEFVGLIMEYREKLGALYKSASSDKEKRSSKEQLFSQMKRDYQLLSKAWPKPNIYMPWLTNNLNNAKLNTVATYHSLVEPLQLLLKQHNFDLPKFYAACKAMKKWDIDKRHQHLLSLTDNQL